MLFKALLAHNVAFHCVRGIRIVSDFVKLSWFKGSVFHESLQDLNYFYKS